MWTGKLGDELVATMKRHGTKAGDRDEMVQICSVLMVALLRGELAQGGRMRDLDAAIDAIADLHHRALRDFDIFEGTTVGPDDESCKAIALWPKDRKAH
jgi:hypothetical protein